MILFASSFEPMAAIADGGGPTHTSAASITAWAKDALSARNPYPGWICVGTGQLCCGDDAVATQVRVGRGAPTQRNRLVGFGNKASIGIGIGEDGDGGDPHLLGGAGDPTCDLAPIGHDQLGDAGHAG